MTKFLEDLRTIEISPNVNKEEITQLIGALSTANGYKVADQWLDKPWGAFWRFESEQARQFIDDFFPNMTLEQAQHGVANAELSPKILLVGPNKRLSWQKHARRAELWRSVAGPAGYHRSMNDENQGDVIDFPPDETVQFDTGERHRLVSGDGWSIVAEIWQHSDPNNPSDEDDIVRIADDFKR